MLAFYFIFCFLTSKMQVEFVSCEEVSFILYMILLCKTFFWCVCVFAAGGGEGDDDVYA